MNKNKKLEPILKRLVNEAQTGEPRSLTSPDPKPIGPVMKRVLADLEAYSDPKEIVYQHTVLCQTVMPYRNPGDAVPMVWPTDPAAYGPEEFEGICSETLSRVIDKRTGRTTLRWKKTRRANEALDLLCYSLALATFLGPGFMLREAAAIRESAQRKNAA